MMPVQQEEIKSITTKNIRKANSLVQLNRFIGKRKGKSMSVLEFKGLTYLMALLDQDGDSLEVTGTIHEFWEACGKTNISGNHANLLSQALQDLRDRSGYVLMQDPVTKDTRAVLVSYLDDVQFFVENGQAKFLAKFNKHMAPALLQLKDNYTEYPMLAIMYLDCKYGTRLLDLLISFNCASGKPITFDLLELMENLDATDIPSCKYKTKVIDKAIADINNNCPYLSVSYELYKTGRQYSHITFRAEKREVLPQPSSNEECLIEDTRVEKANCIKQQISFDTLMVEIQADEKNYDMDLLRLICETMTDIAVSTNEQTKVNGSFLPTTEVQERFNAITREHVEYVMDSIATTKTEIAHPKAFLITALYNAPTTYTVAKRKNTSNRTSKKRKLDDDEMSAIERLLSDCK